MGQPRPLYFFMLQLSILIVVLVIAQPNWAADHDHQTSAAARGYRFLVEKAYLPPDFDDETIDLAWKYWPESFRSEAEKATPEQRRKMNFERYGLTPRPDDPSKPL